MSQWAANVFERRFSIEPERTIRVIHVLGVVAAALLFAVVATFVMTFNTLFFDQSLASLEVGDLAPRDINAPRALTYTSSVLTERERINEVNNTGDVYNPPDPNVARQQTLLARQVLDFINNIRRDPYGTTEQRLNDLQQVTSLRLNEGVALNILELDEDTWRQVDEQIVNVLERVQQQTIREGDLQSSISRLPTQVSVRFSAQEAAVITAIVGDLVRPNTFINPALTDEARERAADDVQPQNRAFVAGQNIIQENQPIDNLAFEALQQFGLLEVSPEERRGALLQALVQAFLTSIIVMTVVGLFIARFSPDLYDQPRFVLLAATLYLIFLVGAQFVGLGQGALYLYPTAAMALLFVSIIGPEVAMIASLGLAMMVGFMIGQQLELTALIGVGGLIGTLSLRRAERLNSYFFAGLMVALANVIVITIFNLEAADNRLAEGVPLVPNLIGFGVLNGLLAAAAAMALMYLVTILFNLPTGLRLVELSQPNQPMLQRLLRDAPGTYQHSLQVANLSEQATNAIGGNAELVRVAALYHDIGKMLNAPFFVENQADGVNPHDEMGDPYRSADIIISHVTEGERIARQNRLPERVRDFIMEHHGTTRVEYFYRQALADADNPDSVDPLDFTYPGPIPQSRETAIMMLADSCESTVRARRPSSKQEINDIVQGIIDARNRSGQLDDSGLTSNDIKTIRTVFVDMLQAVFHPRINYPSVSGPSVSANKTVKTLPEAPQVRETVQTPLTRDSKPTRPKKSTNTVTIATSKADTPQSTPPVELKTDEDDLSPLPDVPPLPRRTTETLAAVDNSEDEVADDE